VSDIGFSYSCIIWDAGLVICLGRGADLHMAQLMPLSVNVSFSSKSRLVLPSWFTFLVPAHPGCPRHSPGVDPGVTWLSIID